ncbi:hypothetical protein HKX48_007157 [Thoreauomyces humboldtii]|nr:hypothetical protein HKX48_007157 [Thoreauomyces humboldtii]
MHFLSVLSLLLLSTVGASAQRHLTGTPRGFARGVVGGGETRPVYPKDNAHLISLLNDPNPQVIYLNRMYHFEGTEGRKTSTGCRPASNTCGNMGQDAIQTSFNWCANNPKVTVNYDVAATVGMTVSAFKTIRGIGNNAGLSGKGLFLMGNNVIIQNILITNLNPQYIWGGDAITLNAENDLVWIDHNRFSLIGRQMIVTQTTGHTRRLTISNNHFDGKTPYSASCNGDHYWTMLFYGTNDLITFNGNYITNTSGRGPKVGGVNSGPVSVKIHAVNNLWRNVGGHAFDVHTGSAAMIEGNTFQNVVTPLMLDGGMVFMPAQKSACNMHRECFGNTGIATNAVQSKVAAQSLYTDIGKFFAEEAYGNAYDPMMATYVAQSYAGLGKV